MSATLTAPIASKEAEGVPSIEAKVLGLDDRVEELLATHRRRSGSGGRDDSSVVRMKEWIELVGFSRG